MAEETIQEEGSDIRRRALFRLAVAAAVTSAALAGLWWLDHSGKQEKAKPTPPPKPIVSAPPPAPALTPEPPEQPAGTEEAPAPAEPPPPPVIGKLPEPAPAAPSVAKPVQPPAPAKPLPGTIVPAAKGGFVVQLGVFSNPDNARELVEKLRQQGIRAEMETRVHVGPFLNRAEAEKAQAELRKLGLTPVVTTVNGARK